jgi:hypothetical protein
VLGLAEPVRQRLKDQAREIDLLQGELRRKQTRPQGPDK